MNTTAVAAIAKNSRPFVGLGLIALGVAALWFIARSALPYFELAPGHFGPHFWPRRWVLLAHITGGVLAITTGVVQLWLGLSNRVAALHRTLGKVYVTAIAVGSIAGFHLALSIAGNLPYAAGLFTLCVAWVITTTMAVLSIRRRNVPQHREWMMRSYAVTFAFVTFRFGVDALIARGVAPAEAQGAMAWACWAVPLLLLEPMIQLRKIRGRNAATSV